MIPEEIQQYKQAPMVFYDNIDRLEEKISGIETSHRVNALVIQKAFTGAKTYSKFDWHSQVKAKDYICRTVTTASL